MRSGVPTLAARMGRHALTAEIAQQLVSRCGWVPGSAIAVGCSGGVDSCALLVACAAILGRRSSRGRAFAIHVHHHLRPDADLDAEHVAALARELDVPLLRRDVHPASRGEGLAADARALRHAALLDAARTAGASHIALAHHADDRLETILMHLGRGSGLRGLGSIPWSRSAARGSGVRIARPMLALARADIEACAREVGIRWREDPGNEDPASARGLLRTRVIPALRARWPRIAERASAAADGARAGRRAGRAWSIGRMRGRPPTRALMRSAGADVGALIVDAWLRTQGVRATWMQLTRIARASAGIADAPRSFRAGCGTVIVRARALAYEHRESPDGR